ncbi:regulator of nonsense transcript [Acrasis kona]|uniref:Regulator of nonsense transcript n=1 Tax=Acrasis kona TaxID=1008807 RepID=A0AAW2ZC98_9EUKA
MSSVVTSVDKESDDTNNSTEAISTRVEKLMNTLNKSCMSRALMTQWILEFSQVNTKSSRKKLVRTMFAVNRTSLELLPHYSRLVAILSTQYKDVPQQLVASLEDEFNKLFNQKDQIKIETKVKNIRFISELTKFKILPPQTTLSLLDKCLNDFRHHNIDVACHLLETCGRFLYVNKDTHEKTVELLEKMMRSKNVKSLDSNYENMVENAYYVSIPVNKSADGHSQSAAEEPLPPLQRYVNHLLYDRLDKLSVNAVLKQLRKLPWNDPSICRYVSEAVWELISANTRYNQVHILANLISGLSRYHEIVGIMIVDRFAEALRLRLAGHVDSSRQRALLELKFIAELYNYQMLDSNVVLDLLYCCILYQCSVTDHNNNDTFRLRQVITLLETAGPYFETPLDRKRLDRFLMYLQWYVLKKGVRLPVDLEFQLADCLDSIRPRLKWPHSFQDADERVSRVEKQSKIPLPGYLDGDSSSQELDHGVMWAVVNTNDAQNDDQNDDDGGNGFVQQEQPSQQQQQQQQQQYQQQDRVQRRIDDLKFDKEYQSVLQESIAERRSVQKPLKMSSVKDMMIKNGLQPSTNPQPSPSVAPENGGGAPAFMNAMMAGKFTLLTRRKAKDINLSDNQAEQQQS